MSNSTQVRLPKGFRAIPDYSSYAVNREGSVINCETGVQMAITDWEHRAGRVKVIGDDGVRRSRNILSLVMATFNLKNEDSAYARLGHV